MKTKSLATTIGLSLGLAVLGSAILASENADGDDGAAVKASRDWKAHPAVVELDTSEAVFAVGDPHGDPARLAGVLAAAELAESTATAPDEVKWTGGKSVLVVTGDLIDKGDDSLGVIALLRALQESARAQGGRVIVTMGNHEAEFLADPTGKKTEELADELEQAGLEPAEVAACVGDLGQFLCALPFAVRVNDWFFSHGGNSNGQSIAELSVAIEQGFSEHGFATEVLVGDNSILEARLNKKGPGGLAWFMKGSKETDPEKVLKDYASKLGVEHIVQGHQYGKVKFPEKNNRTADTLFQRYGILFLIDSGMSDGIKGSDSKGGAVRITGAAEQQEALVICANGDKKLFWSRAKNPDREEQSCDD